MNEEVLKAVLSEILEEQKMLNINNGLLTKAVEDFSEKLSDFENKFSNSKESTGADLQIINRNLQKLTTIIEDQPKHVIYEKRILLFPEIYKQEFYRIVFDNVVKLLAVIIITLFAFFFLKDLLIQKDVRKYKPAWEWLYQHQNANRKSMMDSVIFTSTTSEK